MGRIRMRLCLVSSCYYYNDAELCTKNEENSDQVRNGTVDIKYIDQTVEAILTTKFSLGLFESECLCLFPGKYSYTDKAVDPYPYDDYESTLRTSETRSLLHQMERETIVLLENKGNVLPLSKDIGAVALIGPQVDRVSVSCYPSVHAKSAIN